MRTSRMSRMGMGICGLGLLAAWTPCLWAQAPAKPADPTAVLKVIPADATAFLVIRNLAETNKDVVDIARALGFPLGAGPESIFPAPLDWAKESLGLSNGLAENGSVAFIVPNCKDAESIDEAMNRVAILLPAADSDALIGGLGPQKEGDVTTVTLAGESFAAAKKEGFVILGRTPEAAKAVMGAAGDGIISKMSPDRVKAYASNDFFAWGTPKGISPKMREEAEQALSGIMAMAGAGSGSTQAADESMKEMNSFMDDSEELSVGLSVDQRGLGLSGYFRAKPNSALAKRMVETKAPTGGLLLGLPNEPTVFVLGVVTAAGRTDADMQKVLNTLLDSAPPAGAEEQVKQLKQALLRLWSGTERVSASLSNLPTEGGQSTVGLTLVAEVKDSGKWLDAAHQAFDAAKTVIAAAAKERGEDEKQVQAVADSVQWKKAAEKAGDVSVDQITVDLAKLPDVSPEDAQTIQGLLGAEGMALRIAAVDAQHVIVTVGGGAERIGRLAELVKKGEAPLASSESIQKVASRLPEGPRLMEGYLNIDQALSLFTNAMTRMGQPLPPLAMRNAAPLAFTVTRVDDAAQEVNVVIPVELMVSIKETAAPLVQMFMGGMGGGQPLDMESDDESAPEAEPESELK